VQINNNKKQTKELFVKTTSHNQQKRE